MEYVGVVKIHPNPLTPVYVALVDSEASVLALYEEGWDALLTVIGGCFGRSDLVRLHEEKHTTSIPPEQTRLLIAELGRGHA